MAFHEILKWFECKRVHFDLDYNMLGTFISKDVFYSVNSDMNTKQFSGNTDTVTRLTIGNSVNRLSSLQFSSEVKGHPNKIAEYITLSIQGPSYNF